MRQAVFIGDLLRRYSLTIFACHFCGAHFVTELWFGEHLVTEHRVNDPVLNRFLERESDAFRAGRPNQSRHFIESPSASS